MATIINSHNKKPILNDFGRLNWTHSQLLQWRLFHYIIIITKCERTGFSFLQCVFCLVCFLNLMNCLEYIVYVVFARKWKRIVAVGEFFCRCPFMFYRRCQQSNEEYVNIFSVCLHAPLKKSWSFPTLLWIGVCGKRQSRFSF